MQNLKPSQAETSADFFAALNIPRRPYQLSERQVQVELHPSNTGTLGRFSKAPVLHAQKLAVNVTPDDAAAAGARIEVLIDAKAIAVSSPEFSDSDKGKIGRKVRDTLLESERFPSILFQVQDLSLAADGSSILAKGPLTIHGATVEQFIRFKRTAAKTYEAKIEIQQTAFGLTPLTAVMGTLKSEDRLAIRCLIYLGAV